MHLKKKTKQCPRIHSINSILYVGYYIFRNNTSPTPANYTFKMY